MSKSYPIVSDGHAEVVVCLYSGFGMLTLAREHATRSVMALLDGALALEACRDVGERLR
jgi:hypothetical protein